MAMSRQEKAVAVEELSERLSRAKGGLVVGFQGLNVLSVNEIRAGFREVGAEYKVIKNTLMQRALSESPVREMASAFKGPTAVVLKYDDDLSSLGKKAQVLFKKFEKLELKAAYIDTDILPSKDALEVMASLPTLPEVQAKLLSLMNTPAIQLVSLLNEPAKKLLATTNEPGRLVAAVLQAYAQKDAA